MNRFTHLLSVAAFAGLGPALTAHAASSVAIDPTVSSTWSRFNFVDSFGADNNVNRIRTNVFDAGGGRQITMSFDNLGGAAAALGGLTKSDITEAYLELTVRDFDVELGLYGWTLYSVNDGPDGSFNPAADFHNLPGILDGVDIKASADPAETTVQDTLTLALDNTVDPNFDARPLPGDVMRFDITDLTAITGDTNNTLVLHFHQTTGENSGFRPQWENGGEGPAPRLVLVPEPAGLIGLGALGLAALRRRRA